MPAAPLQPVCLENGLDHTVGKVIQIQRPAYRIRKHPAGCILGLDGIEHKSKRLDDRNYAGVIVILVGLGLLFKVSPPDRTADVQNVPIVVFPPLPSNFALAQTSKRRHSNCRPDNTLSNLGSVRAVLGQNDKSLSAGEKLKMLFHFPKRIGVGSTKLKVDREYSISAGRLDLLLTLDQSVLIVVEVKKSTAENAETAKQAGYSGWLNSQPYRYSKGLLLITDASEENYEQFSPIRWSDLCLRLRSLLLKLETDLDLVKKAMILAFVSAVETNLIKLVVPPADDVQRLRYAKTLEYLEESMGGTAI
jgi:hypothetical protein